MDPLIEATTSTIEQLRFDLHDGLAGVAAEILNTPAYPDGNTIAGLVAHMYDAGNYLLHTGLHLPVVRDRDAQFAATIPDAQALLAHIDQSTANLLGLVARYTSAGLAAHQDYRGNNTVGAWFVMHTCTHLLEHWGGIQTIRDAHKASATYKEA
jgi:hypothetical protein